MTKTLKAPSAEELAAPVRPKKTKLPDSVISGDLYTAERDGVTYYPHAGEAIVFRGEASVLETEHGLRLQVLAKLGEGLMNPGEAAEMIEQFHLVCADLAGHIRTWTWTDGEDQLLPSPPTVDVISALPARELFFLTTAFSGAAENAPASE
jgi:hypothetical protein